MDEAATRVLKSLQAQCSRRECCSPDVMRKALKALDGDAARAEEVLGSLIADGFVDDARYAGAFAREKSALTGWGPVKIRFALAAKGIDKAVVDAALDSVDREDASGRLERLMAAKAKTLEGDPQARLKLIKYALSRGYEYNEVQKHL